MLFGGLNFLSNMFNFFPLVKYKAVSYNSEAEKL